MKPVLRTLTVGVLLCFAQSTYAALIVGNASLSGLQEVPAGMSAATGTATVTIDTVAMTFGIAMSVDGLSLADITFPGGGLGFGSIGPVHIHLAPAGSNGAVAVPFGSLADYTATATGFDLVATGSVLASLDFADVVSAFLVEGTYINVHSLNAPGGEIRGQIVNIRTVPEPLGWALLMLGAAMLLLKRRRCG